MNGNRLVINIFGSAGVGKTTLATKLYNFMQADGGDNKSAAQLKPVIVREYATMLINEGKTELLKDQILVTRNQIKLLQDAFKSSNLVITDSPVDLGLLYNQNPNTVQEVSKLIVGANRGYTSIDLFLLHDDDTKQTYTMQGRVHTLEQSRANEERLLSILKQEKKKPIFINRNADMRLIFAHIQNTRQWREFEIKSEVNRIYVKQLFAGKVKGAERQIG